jgi:molybdopterin-guanine dinucleotide biosynthesis protein A
VRIVDRVAAALRSATNGMMVISNDADAGDWLPGIPAYSDVRPERGSLVGIHSALTHARDDVLVVAWDMPFVSAELLELLCTHRSRARFAVVPEGPAGLDPFCAIYAVECLPVIDAALDAGDLRLSHLLARLPHVERVPFRDIEAVGDPAKLLFNVNTAADLAIAEEMAALD